MFVYVSMEPDKKERLQSRFEMRPAGKLYRYINKPNIRLKTESSWNIEARVDQFQVANVIIDLKISRNDLPQGFLIDDLSTPMNTWIAIESLLVWPRNV